MASALGLHVSLDSSALPSCSFFRPASIQHGAVKAAGRSRTVKCNCSREEESGPRRKAFSTLVATGLALAILTNGAIAATQPPLMSVADDDIVKEGADKLLQEADKLINRKSFVEIPPLEGANKGDAGRISRKAGSGIIDDLQDPGSKYVGEARDRAKKTGDELRERFDESLAKAEDKTDNAKKGLQEFYGQAKDKVTGGADKLKLGSSDLVGDARNNAKTKVSSDINNIKENSKGLFSDLRSKGSGAIDDAKSKVSDNGMNPAGKAKDLVSDAGSKVSGAIAKSKGTGAMEDGMNPAGKAKEFVSDARSKVSNAIDDVKGKTNGQRNGGSDGWEGKGSG